MGNLAELYQHAVRSVFGTYIGTWLPPLQLEVGQVGFIEKSEFKPQGTLADFGIGMPRVVSNSPIFTANVSSKSSTSITAKAAGTVAPQGSTLGQAEAGIYVHFANEDAVVFQGANCESFVAADLYRLERDLLASRRWDRDLYVITSVVQSECSTTLISSSKNATIDVTANAATPLNQLFLTNANIGLVTKSGTGLASQYVAMGNAAKKSTPLYKAAKLRRPWFIFGRRRLKDLYLTAMSRDLGLPVFGSTPGWHNLNPSLVEALLDVPQKSWTDVVGDIPQLSLQEADDFDLFFSNELKTIESPRKRSRTSRKAAARSRKRSSPR